MDSTSISVSIAFHAFHNLQKICSLGGTSDVFWLSWSFLGKTYKSDEFRISEDGPAKWKDVVKLQCKRDQSIRFSIPKEVIAAFPIRMYLCTTNAILGVAVLDPFRVSSVDKENVTAVTPFQMSEWVEVIPVNPTQVNPAFFSDARSCAIRITLDVVNDTDETVAKAKISEGEDEEEEDEYADEDFENEDQANPLTGKGGNGPSHIEGDNPSAAGKGNKEPHKGDDDNDEEQNLMLRHFRLSVDLRSIGGLKRPAHVSLQYIYPYLGSSTPVRTRPNWVMAHSESQIDGGAASFECAMSTDRLRTILSSHQLKVTALTKSHLGNNILGEVDVDLAAVTFTEPHSFRCPVTGRMFKTMEAYNKHRQIMLALLAAGRIDSAPPKDPVTIRALDTYLVFNAPAPESRAAAGTGSATGSSQSKMPNYIVPLAEGGKLRVVVILEDIGRIGHESAVGVKPGYKMHNGAVYDMTGKLHAVTAADLANENDNDLDPEIAAAVAAGNLKTADKNSMQLINPTNPLEKPDLTPEQRAVLEHLKLDWEAWRRTMEAQWRDAMQNKEELLRKKLDAEAAEKLVDRADDLKRAQMEAAKLEVRLRATIEEVERQKAQLVMKDEQMTMRLAQKTAELQLLQRRVRDEGKVQVEAERRRGDAFEKQLAHLQDSFRIMERRAKDCEADFEKYRAQLRSSPESVLREEAARLRAQLGESRAEVERERRLRSETELEKEHFRSQMHRLALALKREREKSSAIARQDLEQLRLEFLAREERYVLDGDRDQLRNIRNDLAHLQHQARNPVLPAPPQPSAATAAATPEAESKTNASPAATAAAAPGRGSTRPYSDPTMPPPLTLPPSTSAPPAVPPVGQHLDVPPEALSAARAVADLKKEIAELLASGMYEDADPVIQELKRTLNAAEGRLAKITIPNQQQ